MAVPDDEFRLLGGAIAAAQRAEFALYGLAAHVAHTPAAQKKKHFRDLTPEKFLRGDVKELKATLGELVDVFGETFLVHTPELVDFYKDRI